MRNFTEGDKWQQSQCPVEKIVISMQKQIPKSALTRGLHENFLPFSHFYSNFLVGGNRASKFPSCRANSPSILHLTAPFWWLQFAR